MPNPLLLIVVLPVLELICMNVTEGALKGRIVIIGGGFVAGDIARQEDAVGTIVVDLHVIEDRSLIANLVTEFRSWRQLDSNAVLGVVAEGRRVGVEHQIQNRRTSPDGHPVRRRY